MRYVQWNLSLLHRLMQTLSPSNNLFLQAVAGQTPSGNEWKLLTVKANYNTAHNRYQALKVWCLIFEMPAIDTCMQKEGCWWKVFKFLIEVTFFTVYSSASIIIYFFRSILLRWKKVCHTRMYMSCRPSIYIYEKEWVNCTSLKNCPHPVLMKWRMHMFIRNIP